VEEKDWHKTTEHSVKEVRETEQGEGLIKITWKRSKRCKWRFVAVKSKKTGEKRYEKGLIQNKRAVTARLLGILYFEIGKKI